MQKWYTGTTELFQQIMIVDGVTAPLFDELVNIETADGRMLLGKVLIAEQGRAVVQVFSSADGLQKRGLRTHFTGHPLEFTVGKELLGRIFNGVGEVKDEGSKMWRGLRRAVQGSPINPVARDLPGEFIQTGVSAIDVLTPLVRGQKLPIFSAAGLPHMQLTSQIVRNAKIAGEEKFAVVFGAMGITHDEAEYFTRDLRRSGALARTVMFINLAGDPVIERLALPRLALTTAEHLAYELGMHVLVVLSDMTNYCNALREVSAALREVPSRRGYPGYLYTDLASIYERAGRLRGKAGSVTQLPVLTMPDGDATHPIPDLTGYITEGQIMLSPHLQRQGVTPPIDVLSSLSRLKDKGIGAGKTDQDHDILLGQLFAGYARGQELRDLVKVLGEEAISEADASYIKFAEELENKFINQGWLAGREIGQSLDLGWQLLRLLPSRELAKLPAEVLSRHPHISEDYPA